MRRTSLVLSPPHLRVRRGFEGRACARPSRRTPAALHRGWPGGVPAKPAGWSSLLLPLPPQLSARDQPRHIVRAADQHALHEHHGKGRPAGPHLEYEAAAVFAQIAAVLEILVREPGGIERLPRLLRKRIHAPADD